jgi:hypothetical protein
MQVASETTILPDGSGKIELTMRLKEWFAGSGSLSVNSFEIDMEHAAESLRRNLQDYEGIVAVTVGEPRMSSAWTEYQVTGYFEDLEQVGRFFPRKGDPGVEVFVPLYAWTPWAGSFELTARNLWFEEAKGLENTQDEAPMEPAAASIAADDAASADEDTDGLAAFFAKTSLQIMLDDLEVIESYRFPGEAIAPDGFEHAEDGSVRWKLVWDDAPLEESIEALAPRVGEYPRSFTVSTDSRRGVRQQRTFQDELLAARRDHTELCCEEIASRVAAFAARNGHLPLRLAEVVEPVGDDGFDGPPISRRSLHDGWGRPLVLVVSAEEFTVQSTHPSASALQGASRPLPPPPVTPDRRDP